MSEDTPSKPISNKVIWTTIFVIFLLICIVVAVSALKKNASNNSSISQSSEQSSNLTQLSNCLNTASDNFSGSSTTTYQLLVDTVSNYQEQIKECQSEYPVSPSSSYQSQYNSCISNVNQWWSNNATSVFLEQYLISVKTVMVLECSTNYPTS